MSTTGTDNAMWTCQCNMLLLSHHKEEAFYPWQTVDRDQESWTGQTL